MKLTQAGPAGYAFEFTLREKILLFKVLALYPLIPAVHHRLHRTTTAPDDDNQQLLEESLTAHREESRHKVRALLTNPDRFPARSAGFGWTASRADMEWMLQVLNEVRVGSWLALGAPDLSSPQAIPSTPDRLRHRWAMDIAGGFEMIFLAALNGALPLEED
jgi:hypothetical protein